MENLIKIQSELKVPKGNYNSFGKYKYRSAEDILEAVKPVLLKYEAQLLLTDRVVNIGTKIFVQSTAILYFKDNRIQGLPKIYETQGYAELAEHKGMSAEQATGTASSYARKYALNGLFLIDETESDADADTLSKSKQVEQPKKTKPKFTEANFERAKGAKATVEAIRERYDLDLETEKKYADYVATK